MVVKQVVGIDVAQNELVVCLGRMSDQWLPELFAGKSFANNPSGLQALVTWVDKLMNKDVPVRFVMEATGVYHEKLAHYLYNQSRNVSIVLPNKISNYVRTLNVKTVTDKTASQAIAQFGLERSLDNWQKPKAVYANLRNLTRERDQVVSERTVLKNQLHAEKAQAVPYNNSIERIQKRINLLNTQEEEIRKEIEALIKEDPEVKQIVNNLCTIPGIGILTAAIVLAETNGFELIRNKRQLTSYAGLDVREKQSGTSVRGKSSISKKGNRNLRKAMYLPGLTATRHIDAYSDTYARIVSRHGIKRKAGVAIQRKLLELIYTIFKNKTVYDPEIMRKSVMEQAATA